MSRSAFESVPLPACTTSVCTSISRSPLSLSAPSTSDSELFAFERFAAYCVLSDFDWVTSSARAEAIGSSAALSMRLLVASWFWVRAMFDCSVLSWVVAFS